MIHIFPIFYTVKIMHGYTKLNFAKTRLCFVNDDGTDLGIVTTHLGEYRFIISTGSHALTTNIFVQRSVHSLRLQNEKHSSFAEI